MNLPNESISPISLHLTFAAGKGVATLRERQLGEIEVERLDLEIPKLVFPFDISGGTARFQSRRCIVRAAAFSVREDTIEKWLTSRTKESELRVKIREGYISVAGRYSWQPEASLDLTARVFADISHARSAFLLLDDLRLYGVPPVPAPLIAASLLQRIQPTLPDTYRVIGTYAAEVEPLRLLVSHYLPSLGWKIPDTREVRLEEVRTTEGKIFFKYGPADAITQAPSPSKETLRAKEALRLFSAAEDLLLQGKLQEALYRLRRDAERVGEHPFIDLRIAEIMSADPEQSTLAQAHIEAALSRHEGGPVEARLLVLISQLYLRDQDPRAAKPFLERLALLAEQSEDPDEALFSGHWIARALRETEPLPALSRLEKLVKHHQGHKPTILALADLYERAGRYEDLALLWRELAATEEDATQAAQLRAQLGDLYLQKLGDPLRAKGQYERALSRDPRCVDAWCGLSDVLVAQNETRAALLAMEEALSAAKTNEDKAKLHVKAGIIWESALSDPESAALRYGEALLLIPQMPAALWRMAELHKARRRYARSAACYEEIARQKSLSASERSRAFAALAELLEDFLGDPEEAIACRRKAIALDPNNEKMRAIQDQVTSPKKAAVSRPEKPSAYSALRPSAPKKSKSPAEEAIPDVYEAPPRRPTLADLETPAVLPAQQKAAQVEHITPPQRPAVKREITPVFLQEDKVITPHREPKPLTPTPIFTPKVELTSQEEDVALDALADLALFGEDFPPLEKFYEEKIDSRLIPEKREENREEKLSGPPKITSAGQLQQAANEARRAGNVRAEQCYQEIADALQGVTKESSGLLEKKDLALPPEATLAPRELFLALSPFVGSLSARLSEESSPGPVTLAEEMFGIAAAIDAPRFSLRWVSGDSARIVLTDVATLELGASLHERPKEERFALLSHALLSLRLSLPLVQNLSAPELEELIFLMAAWCDPVSVVADEGNLSEGLRAQAEALLSRVPESKKESLLPAVSTLLDSYGAIDFQAFQRGLIEESWREVLCMGGSLSFVLRHTASSSRSSVEEALSANSLTRRLALFASGVSSAPLTLA
jgi:tetratricopeptide (TPR) repeat protein